MKYAPVIIPTLNRVNHLKRCLDSLANNYLANKTILLISVDYPPSSKYEKGYNDVLSLLKEYDFSRFQGCRIFYQKSNLNPNGNFDFLIKEATKISDKYITTEDDNEFSPCFLEYINEGLDLFSANDDVIAICGGRNTDFIYDKGCNVFVSKRFYPYGVGSWSHKNKTLSIECQRQLLDRKNYYKNFKSLYKKDRTLFAIYVLNILCSDSGIFWASPTKLNIIDSTYSIYMNVTNKVCISPVLSQSRTFGNDGSGVNMKTSINNATMEIDKSERFSIIAPVNLCFSKSNYKIAADYLKGFYYSKKAILLALFMSPLLIIFGRKRLVVVKIYNLIKKCKI